MKLTKLVENLVFLEKRHFAEQDITGISVNSQTVQKGNLFVAISGTRMDGHDFIGEALKKGAVALVVEREVSVPKDIPVFRVSQSRLSLSCLVAQWYGHPSEKLKVIGVTGTNGKTTICCMLENLLNDAGKKAGRIGTIGYHYFGQKKQLNLTTPEPTEIHRILREMVDQGVEEVLMEASSHAVDMHRVENIPFDIAIFTNLTPEHLDYHKSMELYFESKKRMFTQLLPKGKGLKRAIINAEDPYGLKLIYLLADQDVWAFTTKAQSKWDFFIENWHSDLNGLHGTIHTPVGVKKFSSPLIGVFNLSNILAATAAAISLDVPLASIVKSLKSFSDVPGRLERIPNPKGLHIFVDYAHTPDALKNVLRSLRELDPPKITTVFGCGGDRDPLKRPIMGREVARFSDRAIVTSDNPRTEDPQKIIDEILPGIQEGGMNLGQDCLVEANRRQAIEKALELAQPGEVILVAGKGHEDYQILGTKKIHFDDREVIREFF